MRITILNTSIDHTPEKTWESIQRNICNCTNTDFILLPGGFLDDNASPVSNTLRESVQRGLAELAQKKRCYIVGGSFLENNGKRKVTLLFDRSGSIIHTQTYPFTADQEASGSFFPVIDTEFGRIGILNGNDIWVWESSRIQSLQGAEILFVPGQLNLQNIDSKISALWGLATLNCVAIAFASAASAATQGFATVILPSGVIAQQYHSNGQTALEAEILPGQMAQLRDADLTFRNTLWFGLWSRRKELYGPLLEQAAMTVDLMEDMHA